MNPLEKKVLGSSGLEVTRLGMGCAPLGRLEGDAGQEQAAQVVQRALALDLNLFDTAPLYGAGISEMHLGKALQGVPRDSYVLATKVGRLLTSPEELERETPEGRRPRRTYNDFSYDGVMRSFEESLKAAASQFALAHPAVTCIIPGTRRSERVEENFEVIREEIPADFWAELKDEGLIREDAPVPGESDR